MNRTSMRCAYLITFSLALFQTSLFAQMEQSFLDKVHEIQKNLYGLSAAELQDILGKHFDRIPSVTADNLKTTIEKKPDLCVLNVLPASLHQDCHITGSINVPLKELVDTVASWDRNKEIVVYCALDICDAGQKAYILLSCMGFINVVDYEGGIKEWYQLGYSTEGPAQSSYLHTKTAKAAEQLYPSILVCSHQKKFYDVH